MFCQICNFNKNYHCVVKFPGPIAHFSNSMSLLPSHLIIFLYIYIFFKQRAKWENFCSKIIFASYFGPGVAVIKNHLALFSNSRVPWFFNINSSLRNKFLIVRSMQIFCNDLLSQFLLNRYQTMILIAKWSSQKEKTEMEMRSNLDIHTPNQKTKNTG